MPRKIKVLFYLFVGLIACESRAEVIRYTTWNLQWLATPQHGKLISPNRGESDIRLLRKYFRKTNADIMAFQEVNDVSIISKVVGSDYKVILSQRSKAENQIHQFSDINQYTGFAVKKNFKVRDHKDIKLDKRLKSRLRFASYIELTAPSKQSVHLLSVHLKAGCRKNYQEKRNCRILKEQLININSWIREREKYQHDYIVLGDFNSQMADEAKWAWYLISQKTQAVLTSQNTTAQCYVRSKTKRATVFKYKSIIDHIIISSSQTFTTAKQLPFNTKDVKQYELSDHCPVTIEASYTSMNSNHE